MRAFCGGIVAESDVQLLAFARFIRTVDPLRIDAKQHLRIRVSHLPRNPRRVRAGHQR
jgi:hypothetical protein